MSAAPKISPQVSLRLSTVEDVPAIMEMCHESVAFHRIPHAFFTQAEDLRRDLYGAVPKAWIILAEVDGVPVGLAMYFFNYSSLMGKAGVNLEVLYVKQEYRRYGIGKRLMAELARIAKEQHCAFLEFQVWDENTKGIEFYTRLGAVGSDNWTVYRLKGTALTTLANLA